MPAAPVRSSCLIRARVSLARLGRRRLFHRRRRMDVGADPHLVAPTAQAPHHRPRHSRMVCLEILARRARSGRPLAAAMGLRERCRSPCRWPYCSRCTSACITAASPPPDPTRMDTSARRASGSAEFHAWSSRGCRISHGRIASGCFRRSGTGRSLLTARSCRPIRRVCRW